MSSADFTRAASSRVLGYRFGGVVLDLHRHALVVDGADVSVTPQMLQLLRLLCEADGRLLKRNELFDKLWPGGQDVSDASLSQLVWRLRSALGPYAESVATVRRSGLRLDAAVTTELDFQRAPRRPAPDENAPERARPLREVDDAASSSRAEPAVAATTVESTQRPRRWLAVAAVAVLAVALALAFVWWPRNALVSAGYAMYAADVQASRADTPALIAVAINADDGGERARGDALLRSVHERDATTPVPAAILGWWASGVSAESAKPWIDAAQQRLNAESPTYLRLLVEYFAARSSGHSPRGALNALLDLRPRAWFLQYSRSHDQLGRRELAGALRSLQQIPLDIPDARQLAEVLADRVALGDTAAVQIALDLRAVATDPVLSAYLEGRIAYSRGDLAASVAAFDRCRGVAEERRAYEYQLRGSAFAALAAVESGAADAAARVHAAALLSAEQLRRTQEVEMLGLGVFVAARAGEKDRAAAMLTDAWKRADDLLKPPLLLLALENGLPAPSEAAPIAAEVPEVSVFGGVAELLFAWQAQARGDAAEAHRLLAIAREHGVAATYHAEDAALLAARLGEAPAACRVDPPYPNLLRVTACVLLRDARKN